MALLEADGVEVELPQGWEGQIRRCDEDATAIIERANDATEAAGSGDAGALAAPEPMYPRVLLHAANFALPAERGDYGSGAVELMGKRHVFVAVVEFDRSAAGTALFSSNGVPRRLRPADFHPEALQRTLPGQGGHQSFFTVDDRAFCLYVVLGSHRLANVLVPAVNAILATIQIEDF